MEQARAQLGLPEQTQGALSREDVEATPLSITSKGDPTLQEKMG